MKQLIHILHLEDDPADAELVQAMLESAGLTCQITRVQARDEFGEALRRGGYDVILADYQLPMYDGMSALRLAQELCPDVPFIFVSGTMGEDAAIEGLTEGATDYVLKQKLSRLAPAVRRALHDADNRRERKRAEEALRKLSRAVEQSPASIVITDTTGAIEYVNPKFTELTGYTLEEAVEKNPRILKSGQTPPEEYIRLWNTITSGREWRGEFCNRKKNGEPYWESASISPVTNERGVITHFVAVKEDITERKQAEEQIKAALREKEVLLKEIHHRVKNNMQLILSLLNLQASRIDDTHMLELFRATEGRIRAMSLVQERLYQAPNLAQVQFADYVQRLAANLYQALRVNPDVIRLAAEVSSDVVLSIDKAVPCGLLINELLTNCLRHAFPPSPSSPLSAGERCRGEGEICLKLQVLNGTITLVVGDNGIGLPPGFDWRNPPTLGLRLVNTLVGQLDGSIELDCSQGARFTMTFAA